MVAAHCRLVSLAQTKRKRQAGLGQSKEPQPRPSEEGGRHFRPPRETSRLQEANPAGSEGGTHHFITFQTKIISFRQRQLVICQIVGILIHLQIHLLNALEAPASVTPIDPL